MDDIEFFERNGFLKLDKFLIKDKSFLKFRSLFFKIVLNIAQHNNLKVNVTNM